MAKLERQRTFNPKIRGFEPHHPGRETKFCPACEEKKDVAEFGYKNKATGKRQSFCRECNRSYARRYYKENSERIKSASNGRRVERISRMRVLIDGLKGSASCVFL